MDRIEDPKFKEKVHVVHDIMMHALIMNQILLNFSILGTVLTGLAIALSSPENPPIIAAFFASACAWTILDHNAGKFKRKTIRQMREEIIGLYRQDHREYVEAVCMVRDMCPRLKHYAQKALIASLPEETDALNAA